MIGNSYKVKDKYQNHLRLQRMLQKRKKVI